ncbi:MAG TPA: sigma-54 dependent transcriptional regulator [Blastocatellia bacterium]|jgi:DNA-binding NtrC family response regulator|nr:sigma-54 dependent transcriptional regulator [Blastocatellia bacterium]
MAKKRVLIIDDDQSMLELAEYHLQAQGYETARAQTGEEGLRLVETSHFDVALTDLQLPDLDGIEVVRRLKDLSPGIEIIMVSGYGSVSKAVEATKAGAFYFVEKPVAFEELMVLIEKAVERGQQAEEIKQLRGRLTSRTSYYDIIGNSKLMQDIYEVIDSVAESDANILILGESGTGKEMIANAIHFKSLRGKKPFVKINCSALPKELIESELFGHTKGAFTGATLDKTGLISRAEGGSLLLDEIAEMPVELQPKLLRVLQERTYYRLGSEKAQEADFRLISATNRDPLDAVREGKLREDLYYRVNTIEIRLPPLRERVEDIQRLAEHFLQEFAMKYQRPALRISQDSYQRLFDYTWPGNVRELQSVLERAVLLCKGDTLTIETLPFGQAASETIAAAASVTVRTPAATVEMPVVSSENEAPPASDELTFDDIGRLIVERVPDPKNGGLPVDVFGNIERAVVSAALSRTKGNKQAAASLLGLYRPRLYSLIKKHNVTSR